MPPEATLVPGTVFAYEDRLHIVAGRFEAEHRRRKQGERPAPLSAHRAAKIAAVHGKRAKLYKKRQQLLNLGPDALALLTEITHREPRLASLRVEELFTLLERLGDGVLRAAIRLAVEDGDLSVTGVHRAIDSLAETMASAVGSVDSGVLDNVVRGLGREEGGRA